MSYQLPQNIYSDGKEWQIDNEERREIGQTWRRDVRRQIDKGEGREIGHGDPKRTTVVALITIPGNRTILISEFELVLIRSHTILYSTYW